MQPSHTFTAGPLRSSTATNLLFSNPNVFYMHSLAKLASGICIWGPFSSQGVSLAERKLYRDIKAIATQHLRVACPSHLSKLVTSDTAIILRTQKLSWMLK
jgi:hypothetical protein